MINSKSLNPFYVEQRKFESEVLATRESDDALNDIFRRVKEADPTLVKVARLEKLAGFYFLAGIFRSTDSSIVRNINNLALNELNNMQKDPEVNADIKALVKVALSYSNPSSWSNRHG
ncbi:MAG: hypothetical protein JSS09_08750 [Verrucomicrobia bacterium]|nr:hypothetical protein [Verrucomicrobiota bacterium]